MHAQLRGWAKIVLGRYRDLVQHPSRPRPAVAEANDANEEEARAFYRHTQTPWQRERGPKRNILVFFLLLLVVG